MGHFGGRLSVLLGQNELGEHFFFVRGFPASDQQVILVEETVTERVCCGSAFLEGGVALLCGKQLRFPSIEGHLGSPSIDGGALGALVGFEFGLSSSLRLLLP